MEKLCGWSLLLCGILLTSSCKEHRREQPSAELIDQINLKSGDIITCGPPEKEFGSVSFETSCGDEVKDDFDLAMELLHSFEYSEAEKEFAHVIKKQPNCAMAYWGVAMSNFHPLWTPPLPDELKKGAMAIEIGLAIDDKTLRETEYLRAIDAYYRDWKTTDHKTRCSRFEKAMEKLHSDYPEDKEAAVFYSLALDAAADPADKTFVKQRKAGNILTRLYASQPNHPGIVHYIIHTFDYPELAAAGLPAARKYASVAPSSAHALHMPSHIFTRLGLWDEAIASNMASVESAKCYAEASGIKGHWDEELHGLDYLVYAYLQKGDNQKAKKQLDYLETIKQVSPVNFKVAYAFAAIPSRYLLENKLWRQAALLESHYPNFSWKEYPWQVAVVHFTRLLGSVHVNELSSAERELATLKQIRQSLIEMKDDYKANQVDIQIKAGEAWIKFKKGSENEALALMKQAADKEDNTEKHPVTPGEVLPARELLGDLLMAMHRPGEGLRAYQEDLKKHPNRFNALYGAGLAARLCGNRNASQQYFKGLLAITQDSQRPEVATVRRYLNSKNTQLTAAEIQ